MFFLELSCFFDDRVYFSFVLGPSIQPLLNFLALIPETWPPWSTSQMAELFIKASLPQWPCIQPFQCCVTSGISLQLSALLSARRHNLALHRGSSGPTETPMQIAGASLLINSSHLSHPDPDLYLFSLEVLWLCQGNLSLLWNTNEAERHSETTMHFAGFPSFECLDSLWSNPRKQVHNRFCLVFRLFTAEE